MTPRTMSCGELAAENEQLIAQRDALLAALKDMRAGWRYLRQTCGDLYGVGWERCESSATAALALCEPDAKPPMSALGVELFKLADSFNRIWVKTDKPETKEPGGV